MLEDLDRARTQYDALHRDAIIVDRSARGRMRFTGAKAGEVLTGLVTNDVQSLSPGEGLYAAALTPKGRIVADPRIFAGDGWFLADVPERARAGWNGLIQKFVNPRLAKYVDESDGSCDVGVFGPHAARVVATVTGAEQDSLAEQQIYDHRAVSFGPHAAIVVRVPDALVAGYEIIAPGPALPALRDALARAGATPADAATWDIVRVEAGRPEWGVDMDETTIPQEANFDELGAISYSKGCYTGQEVVARVHFRGHVNRHLRGLRADAIEPLRGARLVDAAGAEVGDVRSAVTSPRYGPIAMGMVRREVPMGAVLRATWEGGACDVTVVALPFAE